MAKAACILCGQRAKRVCILKNNMPVCALCCRENVIQAGSKCSRECPYYLETYNYLQEKATDRFQRFMSHEPHHYFMNRSENELYALFVLFKSLMRGLEKHPDTTDANLKMALDALRSELIASRSKIIYDGAPLSPRANELFITMTNESRISEKEQEPSTKNEPKKFILDELPRESVETAFSIMGKIITTHQTPDERGFVSFIQSLS